MRVLRWAFFTSLFITGALFILRWVPGDELLYYKQIEDHFHHQLNLQKEDLEEFKDKFSVYTNPFDITSSESFLKLVYVNGSLVYWSDNQPLPGYGALKKNDSLYTVTDANGVFIIRRSEIPSTSILVEVFSLLPVVKYPPVSNQYLHTVYNQDLFDGLPVMLSNDGFSIWYGGKMLLRVVIDFDASTGIINAFYLFVFLTIILLCFIIFFLLARGKSGGVRVLLAVLLTVACRAAIYGLSLMVETKLIFFDPIYYTEGGINRSIGDLLLNSISIFILSIAAFRNSKWMKVTRGLVSGNMLVQWFFLMVSSVTLLLLSYVLFQVSWDLLRNSQIELDIHESIVFNSLKIVTLAILAINALSYLLLFGILQKIFIKIKMAAWLKLLFFLLSYGVVCTMLQDEAFIYLGFVAGIWWIIYFTGLSYQFFNLRYQTFLYLVLVLSLASCIYSYSIYKHFEYDQQVSKEKYANRLLIKNDILGEYYLSQTIKEIEKDPYIRSRLLSRLLARQNIREKIKRQFLSSYFKKYDIDVHLFGSDGRSFDQSSDTRSYSEWKEDYQRDEYKTDYEGLYFIDGKTDNIRNKYLCFLSIEGFNRQVGYIILELALKKFIPTSIFPELLVESKYYMSNTEEFDYAVYRDNEVLYKQGKSGFEATLGRTDFNNPKLFTDGIKKKGIHYYGLATSDGRVIVIASSTYSTGALFANFSFMLVILLMTCGFVFVIMRIFRTQAHLNLSTKIQLYLGFSFILPMFVIAVALLNTLNIAYREEIDRNFLKRSFNVAENLIDLTEGYMNNEINKDDYANKISEAATLVQNDLNIYDASGFLITSSQPEIFRLGMLGQQVKPVALNALKYNKEQVIISDELIGELEFKLSYAALRSYQDGRLMGIVSMPYFESRNHLNSQEIEVFNNLISIFTIIFLFALFAGNAIVTQLVKPLKEIAVKIRRTSLQETNQPIQYDAYDEIGSLVKEYNQMLVKLEESKEALAASQKESAWKEIARQVAHEIKNPLTPMRLKIQQMMRSLDRESHHYKSLSSLIEQIDALSRIADSFSAFAKMPAPQNEHFVINDLLHRVAELYQSNEVTLRTFIPEGHVAVFADPNIVSGILNNIILNGIQSVKDKKPEIDIAMRNKGKKVLISIRDNGQGIPEELREKVFTSYFSTKVNGSGIGLAVAKKGIEHAGGNIWFETKMEEGTAFFISLPALA